MWEPWRKRWIRLPILVYLALGLGATWLAAHHATATNREVVDRALHSHAEALFQQVSDRIFRYQYGLRDIRGIALTVDEHGLSREKLHQYGLSRDLRLEFPGARGFGLIFRVAAADQQQFVQAAQADGQPNFQIKQITPHVGERFVVQYVEPQGDNEAAIGLDIASEANRQAAAIQAMQSGQATLTAPITLVQDNRAKPSSFLILLPMYKGVLTPPSREARARACTGWAYAPLVIDQVLAGLPQTDAKLEIRLLDITDPTRREAFYDAGHMQAAAADGVAVTRDLYGRHWQLQVIATPAFLATLPLTDLSWIYGTGVSTTVLFVALLAFFSANRQHQQALSAAVARQAAIVDSSNDAIIAMDLDGVVQGWNGRAEKMFGISQASAVGRSALDLIVPAAHRQEALSILAAVRIGDTVELRDTVRQRADGSLIPVDVVATPIRHGNGSIIGVAKTMRDIGAQKAWQQRLIEANSTLEQQVLQRTLDLAQAREVLQTMLDSVPNLIGYWDAHEVSQVLNRAYEEVYDIPFGTMSVTAREVLGEDTYQIAKPYIDAVLRGEPQQYRREQPPQNGLASHYMLVNYVPRHLNGDVVGFYSIVTDVTELELSQRKLLDVLEENKVLLDAINQQFLFSMTDSRGIIVDVNDNFCQATGFGRDELIGASHRILNSGMHPPEFWRDIWSMLLNGQSWHGEVCDRNKDGDLRWFETVIAPLSRGRAEGRYISLRTDITERKANGQAVADLNSLLSNILDSAVEVAVIATDVDGRITLFNRGAERMLGYTTADMVDKCTPLAIHLTEELEERAAALTEEFGELAHGFGALTCRAQRDGADTRQWTYVRQDGTVFPVSLSVTPMLDEHQVLRGFLSVAINISVQEDQKRALRAVGEQLALATDVAELGVWSWTPGADEVQWNEQMYRIYGLGKPVGAGTIRYSTWRAAVHQEDIERVLTALNEAISGSINFDLVFRIQRPDGDYRFIKAAAHALRDDKGRAYRMTGINVDITDQQNLQLALQEAKRKAEEASAAKSAFLANMSHEIRTPMNAVIGMLQLAERTHLDERQRDYVSKARSAATSLLGLLNDVLDFSKIEAGKLELDLHAFYLEKLLHDIVVVLLGNKKSSQVEVVIQVSAEIPEQLLGDRLRLQQILTNLTGNALKFTEHGEIGIDVVELARSHDEIQLRFCVSDSGIGIAPAQQVRIFDSFVQAESSTSRRFGGTGLGLPICKYLVEMMGGRLQLDSVPGAGSRFWFDLTLRYDATSAPYLPRDTLSRQILIVGDKGCVTTAATAAIAAVGWRATVVTDRESAQTRFGQEIFDATLLADADCALTDVAKATMALDPGPTLALVSPQDRERLLAALATHMHCTAVLTKPATPHQLIEALRNVILGTGQASTARDVPCRLKGFHILVVEDNVLNRQVAKELLSQEGAAVTLATTGLEGVEKVLQSESTFDLVLMDMQMPDIDGLEASRRIRADGRFIDLPIVAMTANVSKTDREICIAAGMNDHIGKPIEIDVLVARVLALLSAQKRMPGTGKAVPATIVASTKDLSIESAQSTIRRFGGNEAFYREMLAVFPEEAERLLSNLAYCVESRDGQGTAQELHALKGVAATIGASGLAHWLAELERDAKDTEASHIAEVLNPLQLERLSQAIRFCTDQLRTDIDRNAPPRVNRVIDG